MKTSTDEKEKRKDLALKVSTTNNDVNSDGDEEVAHLFPKFKRVLILRKEGITKASKNDSNDVMK